MCYAKESGTSGSLSTFVSTLLMNHSTEGINCTVNITFIKHKMRG